MNCNTTHYRANSSSVPGDPTDEEAPADLPTLLKIFAHCAAALVSMHHLRLVHCDVKPHNVLVCAGGKIKLIDFGQTCKIGVAKQRIQGTADFISPEQVKCVAVDPRTDVYGLGASLYASITGQRVPTYFNADRAKKEIVKKQTFPSPRDLRPDVPQAVSDLVMQCVRYNPDFRPADMVTVLKTLEGLIAAPPAPPAVDPATSQVEPKKPTPRVVKDWGI